MKNAFLFKDLSGRGFTCKIPKSDVLNAVSDNIDTEEETEELAAYLERATEGDEFISNSFKLIKL